MKTRTKLENSSSQIEAENLTFGKLIAATYDAYGEKRAPKILQQAIDSHVVCFKRASERAVDFVHPRGA